MTLSYLGWAIIVPVVPIGTEPMLTALVAVCHRVVGYNIMTLLPMPNFGLVGGTVVDVVRAVVEVVAVDVVTVVVVRTVEVETDVDVEPLDRFPSACSITL